MLVLKLITVAATDESELMEAIHREGLVLDDSQGSLTTQQLLIIFCFIFAKIAYAAQSRSEQPVRLQ